jgi:hypothetical protein
MKTLLMWLTLSSLLFSNATFAQTSKKEFKIVSAETPIDRESKALKNFKRSHPDAIDESWSTDNGYYFVKFKDGGIKNKIAYTPDGNVDYALKLYNDEKNLPRAVTAAVKSTYYDYRILNAQELQVKHNTIYLVKITDANSWKTIRVSNGELEEIENYSTVISPCR